MKFCRNHSSGKGSKICHKHKKQRYKERHPVKYFYNCLKQNAKRRGKSFNLTFEEFEIFCHKTEYLNKKGISATGYHIDRIDHNLGYEIGNIQILTNSENAVKGNEEKKQKNLIDCPF